MTSQFSLYWSESTFFTSNKNSVPLASVAMKSNDEPIRLSGRRMYSSMRRTFQLWSSAMPDAMASCNRVPHFMRSVSSMATTAASRLRCHNSNSVVYGLIPNSAETSVLVMSWARSASHSSRLAGLCVVRFIQWFLLVVVV